MNLRRLARSAAGVLALATPAIVGSHAAAQDTMVVTTYGGNLERLWKEIYKPFEAKHGVAIQWVSGGSADNAARALATKANPEYDVILTDAVSYITASRQGVFRPIDPAALTHYADLHAKAKLATKDALIMGFYYTGLFYRPAEFEQNKWTPPKVWADLLRPEFCKRIGLNAMTVTYGLDALIMLAGGKPENVDEGVKRLGALKNCIAVLEPTAAQMEQKIQSGEYLVGAAGNIRIGPLIKQGAPVRMNVPEDGSIMGGAVVAPIRNAPHPKHVDAFIDWIFTPQAQELLVQQGSYGPANTKVAVTPQMREYGVPDAAQIERMIVLDQTYVQAQRRKWTRDVEAALFQ